MKYAGLSLFLLLGVWLPFAFDLPPTIIRQYPHGSPSFGLLVRPDFAYVGFRIGKVEWSLGIKKAPEFYWKRSFDGRIRYYSFGVVGGAYSYDRACCHSP